MMKNRSVVFTLLAVIAALWTYFYVLSGGGNFPLDDSWIHQTYGRNLGTLGEWSFLPGQPSAASTSPLYTILLSVGYRLSIDFRLWTHMLGGLALALTGIAGVFLAKHLIPDGRRAWMVGLALVTAWHLIWAAASGMETALFSLLTLVMIASVSHIESLSLRRGVNFGGFAALLMLTRPEGVILAALAGLVIIVRFFKRAGIRQLIMFFAAAAAMFALLTAPYFLYNLNLTGGLLPNTAAAKRSQAAALFELSYFERLIRMIVPLLAGGQILLIPGWIVFVINTIRHGDAKMRPVRWLLIGWGIALIALYAAWLPLDMQHGRYVIPALPALITAGVIGTLEWVRASRRTLIGRVIGAGVSISTAIVFIAFALSLGRDAYTRDVAIIDGDMVMAAAWVAENIPPETLIAIHDIGAVGYFAPRPMLDIGGLISPQVIPIIRDAEALWSLIESSGAEYLIAYPYQTPGENPDDPRLCPVFRTNNSVTESAGGTPMIIFRITMGNGCVFSQ